MFLVRLLSTIRTIHNTMVNIGMIKSLFKQFARRKKHGDNVFYCNALSGQSNYNICINCDMTVSCNCQDYDGSGHIGDLREKTFEEIFRDGKAKQFREKLARAEFPLPLCPMCSELRKVQKSEVGRFLYDFELPRGIMVENTILCNFSCRFCDRKRAQKIRGRNRMPLVDMELVAKIIHDIGIEKVCFFNLGEPFVSDTFTQEVGLLKKYNPDLQMYLSTNGALIDTEEKVRTVVEFYDVAFSIDGPDQEVLVKYQVGGNFEKSYTSLKRVVAERNRQGKRTPVIQWKYVVFNWNDQEKHINKAIELARDAGVDFISFTQGGAPFKHKSRRYTFSPFFQNLGEPSWRGREIWFVSKP
jgi:pyruvate-formate lyase-activating enzyme